MDPRVGGVAAVRMGLLGCGDGDCHLIENEFTFKNYYQAAIRHIYINSYRVSQIILIKRLRKQK
jgi:hypothetical protein